MPRRQGSAEADDVIGFARTWAPFGGAPADETFVRFGMWPARFNDRLWQIVAGLEYDARLIHSLAQVYPEDEGIACRDAEC